MGYKRRVTLTTQHLQGAFLMGGEENENRGHAGRSITVYKQRAPQLRGFLPRKGNSIHSRVQVAKEIEFISR